MMVCVCAIRLPPAGHGGSQHENLVRWPGEPLRLGSTHMATPEEVAAANPLDNVQQNM
jgi:hypothetical protein